MSTMPYHRRFHSDALHGYSALTLEQRGAYTTILDLLYDRGSPLPENERLLAGQFGVGLRKARSIIQSLVDAGKIRRTDDGSLTNLRFEKEREKQLKMSRKQSENRLKPKRNSAENEKKTNESNVSSQPPFNHGSTNLEARSYNLESQHQERGNAPTSRDRAELDRIEAALRSVSGLDKSPNPNVCDLSPILALIDANVSFEGIVLSKAKAMNGKLSGKAHPWKYLAAAIAGDVETDQRRAADIQSQTAVNFDDSDERWLKRLSFARKASEWSVNELGPLPGEPGCRVPEHLLQPGDGINWKLREKAA